MELLANPSDEHFDFRSKTFYSVYLIQLILKLKFRKEWEHYQDQFPYVFNYKKKLKIILGLKREKTKAI